MLATRIGLRFINQYYPEGDKTDGNTVYAYAVAQTLIQVLKQCGNDLTRQNVMRQAADLHNLQLEMVLPGITIDTSPTDFAPLEQMRMVRFNGQTWSQFGPVLDSSETAGN